VTWSQSVNSYVYQIVALVLQSAQARNVTIPGGDKYNVPSGNITIDQDSLNQNSVSSTPNLTSYSIVAISGADDFRDNNTQIKDVFDDIVENTRDVSPTCVFSHYSLVSIFCFY